MRDDSKHLYIAHYRRTFLKTTAGIAGAGFLAGCSGDGGSDGEDGSDGSDGSHGADGSDGADGGDGSDGEDGSAEPDFPQEGITLIIPYSPGGGYDAYTRLAAKHLPKHLPNDVNVQAQNVEGAGGIIGTEQIYNADPDGYTNGIINVSKLGRDQIISDVDFDLREITYYGTVALEVPLITVGPHAGIGSWDEFVDAIQNGELTFGTTGPASTTAANAYLPGRSRERTPSRTSSTTWSSTTGRQRWCKGSSGRIST